MNPGGRAKRTLVRSRFASLPLRGSPDPLNLLFHAVTATIRRLQMEGLVILQVFKCPAEIAAAPVRLFCDFHGDRLGQSRIVGEDDDASTLVPEGKPAIFVRHFRLARLNIDGAG